MMTDRSSVASWQVLSSTLSSSVVDSALSSSSEHTAPHLNNQPHAQRHMTPVTRLFINTRIQHKQFTVTTPQSWVTLYKTALLMSTLCLNSHNTALGTDKTRFDIVVLVTLFTIMFTLDRPQEQKYVSKVHPSQFDFRLCLFWHNKGRQFRNFQFSIQ